MQQTKETFVIDSQEPMNFATSTLMTIMVLCWAGNAIAVKVVVQGIPPLWAALIRFGCTLPFIIPLLYRSRQRIQIDSFIEFRQLLYLAAIMAAQIYCLHLGSKYTTGGRVALFTFSFPVFVPFLSALLIPNVKLSKAKIIGSLIAFVGLSFALKEKLGTGGLDTLNGDIIELFSCILLALMMVYNKRLVLNINKWKVLFWQFLMADFFFLAGAYIFESHDPFYINHSILIGLAYQVLIIGILCWLLLQYLIAKHEASSVTVFFFLTPIFGAILGSLLLNEKIDSDLLIGCFLVGGGIYIVERSN